MEVQTGKEAGEVSRPITTHLDFEELTSIARDNQKFFTKRKKSNQQTAGLWQLRLWISKMGISPPTISREHLLLQNMPQAIRWRLPRGHGFASVLSHVFSANLFSIVDAQVDGFVKEC
jgi:hypothetical protein